MGQAATFTMVPSEDLARLTDEVALLRQAIERCTIIPEPTWKTKDEAMAILGITSSTFYRWKDQGRIETKGSGRSLRVRVVV